MPTTLKRFVAPKLWLSKYPNVNWLVAELVAVPVTLVMIVVFRNENSVTFVTKVLVNTIFVPPTRLVASNGSRGSVSESRIRTIAVLNGVSSRGVETSDDSKMSVRGLD